MAGYNATLTGATSAPLNVTDATESRRYYESGAGDQEEYAARMLFVVLGPFFLIFGSAGNILSLVVLRSGEFKELSTCFYMSVLAVMDTGYLWAGTFVWWVINLTEWRVNPETWLDCKLDWFLFYFFGQCSSTTLVVMTAEKCFALYFPLKARYICTVRSAQWTSVVMVTVYIVYNSQSFFVMKKFEDELGFDYCKTVHTPENYMKTFHLVHSVIYSYVPIVSMAMLNVALCRKLRQSAKVSVALSGSSGSGNGNWKKAAKQGTKMLLMLTSTFIALTTPVCIYFAIADDALTYSPLAFSVTLNLQWANHSINAFLYILVGSTYRKAVHKMLQCRKSNQVANDSGNGTGNSTGSTSGSRTGSGTGFTTINAAGDPKAAVDINRLQVPGRRPEIVS